MRKSGENAKVEIEVGTVFYPMAELTSVSTPAADVNKKFDLGVSFISDQKSLQPVVRLDGVISGFAITPGANYNEVDVAAGKCYFSGVQVDVTADTISSLTRPTVQGNVKVIAITVDSSGTISATEGTEGTAGGARGAAGGAPFLPVDEILLGYVNMTYYDGSASGDDTVETDEIDSESKERTILPSYKVFYYDGSGSNPTYGAAIEFASALPDIHAATAAGPGTDCRAVFGSFYEPVFEQLPDAKDFDFDETIGTITSKAYQDSAEEKSTTTPSWSSSGSAYFSTVSDLMSQIKNSKRWVKIYPDADETPHWAGRAIVKVSRTIPTEDNMMASLTLEGSGELYPMTS
jgi:hypothetical protein